MMPRFEIPPSPARNERGAALVLVLLVAFAVLSLGMVGSRSARIETQIARYDVQEKQALALAEGGLNHAFTLLRSAGSFDDELDGNNDGAHDGTGGVLASSPGLGSSASYDWDGDGTGESARFRNLGAGGYFVRVEDNWDETDNLPARDSDQSLRIVSVGVAGPAERRVEGTVAFQGGVGCAITVEGNVKVNGNIEVRGDSGCLHTNGNITQNSGERFDAGVTSAGTMVIDDNPVVESPWDTLTNPEKAQYISTHSRQPRRTLPKVCPLDFGPGNPGMNLAHLVKDHPSGAGYLLSNNCLVYQGGTSWGCTTTGCNPVPGGATEVGNATNGWNGWKCSNPGGGGEGYPDAKWVHENGNTFPGIFFVAGWVNIGDNPVNWRSTVIAMNTIDVSGNPTLIVPYSQAASDPLRNVLFVAGNDLGISGNLGNTANPAGLFVHQQIKFNGNPTLNGFVIATDGNPACPGGQTGNASSQKHIIGSNEMSGNSVITYNGNVDTALVPGTLTLTSWNEAREP